MFASIVASFVKALLLVARGATWEQSLRKVNLTALSRRHTIGRPTLAALVGLALLIGSTPVQAVDDTPNATVTLTVTRVKQIDNVDATRPGELYARARINQQSFPKTGHREDDGDVRPNWTFTAVVRAYRTVTFSIDIWDEDYPDADDHCDASPARRRKQLFFYYNFRTGEIAGDVTGNADDLLHARGGGGRNRVEVWCRIAIARSGD